MKWVVVGAGGVGGYFGGKLALAGEDVWFVARGDHLEALAEKGLAVHAVDGNFFVPPGKFVDRLDVVGPVDVVLFCVKSYDTDSAARLLSPSLGEHTRILSLQNGIDNDEKIRRALPDATKNVSSGAAYIFSTITSPGVVTQTGGPRKIVFGEAFSGDPRALAISKAFAAAGIVHELSSDIRASLWTKFTFISAIAALTTLTRLTIGEILAVPETQALLEKAMRESEQIARARGVDLPANVVGNLLETLSSLNPESRSSMYDDLVRGRRLEIDAFSGTLERMGRELGVPTPIHSVFFACIKAVGASRQNSAAPHA